MWKFLKIVIKKRVGKVEQSSDCKNLNEEDEQCMDIRFEWGDGNPFSQKITNQDSLCRHFCVGHRAMNALGSISVEIVCLNIFLAKLTESTQV